MSHPFGDAAVKLGFVTPGQVTECLRSQAEAVTRGEALSIAELLQARGSLTADKVRQVHEHLGFPAQAIPGYEILAFLGRGGMGAVYRAQQIKMNRPVAIKVLSDSLASDQEFVQRFYAEARSAAQFNHRNLVAAYDAGSAGDLVYFVMEYVRGRSLKAVIARQGPMEERKAVLAAVSVVEALRALEQRGMVHRDLKPDNIMVTDEGVVKLCDFGLAKQSLSKDRALTVAGQFMGTPLFMSPEQIRGGTVDIRSDFYALGATLYTLTTGKPPFEGASIAAVLAAHLDAAPPDPRAAAPSLSPAFASLVTRLLAKNPDERPKNGATLLLELRALLGSASAATPPSAILGRPAWIAGTVATATLALAFAAYAVLGGATPVTDPPGSAAAATATPAAAEEQARRLLTLAESHYARSAWEDARAAFESLRRDHAATRLFTERSTLIANRLRLCEAALKEADSRMRTRLDAVDGSIAGGQWTRAIELIEQALQDSPSAPHRAQLEERNRACRLELEVADLAEAVDKAARDAQWKQVLALQDSVRPEMMETRAGAKTAARRAQVEEEARLELRALAARDELLAAVEARDVGRTVRQQKYFATDFRDTRTFREASDLRARALALPRIVREKDAQLLLDVGEKQLEAGRHAEAAEAAAQLNKKFHDTDFYRRNTDRIVDLTNRSQTSIEEVLFDCEIKTRWVSDVGKKFIAARIESSPDRQEGRYAAQLLFPSATQDQPGVAAFPCSVPARAYAITFQAKAGKPFRIAVALVQGEEARQTQSSFLTTVDLTAAWEKYEIQFKDLQRTKESRGALALDVAAVKLIGFLVIDKDKANTVLLDDIKVLIRKF